MKHLLLTFALIAGIQNIGNTQDVWVLDSTVVHVEIVLDSSLIEAPWDLNWGPDDKIWFNDLEYVQTYDPITGIQDTVLFRPGENALGLEVHDDLMNGTPYVFVAYDTTAYYGGGSLINLYRYEYSGGQLINPLLLISYQHGGEHSGGRIVITDDDKILITTADYWFGGDPLMGRTLRLNMDGTIPADNPNPASYEYTSGHRNPQGLVQLPNGNVYNTEHGQAGNDEINLIVSGGHYGWPAYDGIYCTNVVPDSCTSGTYSYVEALNAVTAPPAGVDYYNHTAIPEFKNSLLVGTLWSSVSLDVHSLNTAGDSIIDYHKYLNVNGYHRIRDVAVAPDGSVYFIGFDREIPTAIYRLYNPFPASIPEEGSFDNLMSLYPNPAIAYCQVVFHPANMNRQIIVMDMQGRIMYTEIVGAGQSQIALDTQTLSTGTYLVQMQSTDGELLSTKKLIVQK